MRFGFILISFQIGLRFICGCGTNKNFIRVVSIEFSTLVRISCISKVILLGLLSVDHFLLYLPTKSGAHMGAWGVSIGHLFLHVYCRIDIKRKEKRKNNSLLYCIHFHLKESFRKFCRSNSKARTLET